jgi:hypothetical protein
MASEIRFKGNVYMQTTTTLTTFFESTIKLRTLYCFSFCQNRLDPEHLQVIRSRPAKKGSDPATKLPPKMFYGLIFLS